MSERTAKLLAELTLDEKVSLLAGASMWNSVAVPRLGIPAIKVTDGPAGARGAAFQGGVTAACFPCGSALGATWNPALIEELGAALGDEARSKAAHVLLAPTVNLHRSPLGGRNFECYSEDPLLTARTAVAFVRGVQSRGVGACIKHFACNDSEFERNTISSDVGERALREIYLPPFEAAVREADTWSMMASYNRVNGVFASENRLLLDDILRGEWGFEGVVISDWFGTRSAGDSLVAGLDLEMPGPPQQRGDPLLAAVRAGDVPETAVDAAVRRILSLIERAGALDEPPRTEEVADDRREHRALARRAAAESIVLLKNERQTLPVDASVRRLAVIGPNAAVGVIEGGGSARVNPHYVVSPLAGLRARAGDGVEIAYARGCSNHRTPPPVGLDHLDLVTPDGEPGLRVEFFAGTDLEGSPVVTKTVGSAELIWIGAVAEGIDPAAFSACIRTRVTPKESGIYTLSLTSVGVTRLLVDGRVVLDDSHPMGGGEAFFGMGSPEVRAELPWEAGREVDLTIEYRRQDAPIFAGLVLGCALPEPSDLVERAAATAAAADAALVIVGLNRDWETEGRDRADLELPGRQVELIEAVVAANPRTAVVVNAGAPVRMDWIDRVPAAMVLWYPGQECGNALADVVFGDADPGGRLPTTFPVRLEDSPAFFNYPGENGHVLYGEEIFVGYRGYDRRQVDPRFAFGHGLSYASFSIADATVAQSELAAGVDQHVSVDVTNTSDRAGSEVVQLYLRDVEARLARPVQELAAFEKVSLEPGETRRVEFTLAPRALSYWDPEVHDWVAEPGEFEVRIGRSSRDHATTTRFRLLADA